MERSGTRIKAVMAEIRSRIASRIYMPGTRLPSVRAQARAMQLSVSTVLEAYERLAAEGIIASRRGSGFYVTGPAAPLALTEIGPRLDREVDPLWVSRQSLEANASVLKPGCGWLPPAWLYEAGMGPDRVGAAGYQTLIWIGRPFRSGVNVPSSARV